MTSSISPDVLAARLQRLRDQRPRVHCITNTVAQTYTANALLALGAIPSMTIWPEEIEDFVGAAEALLVNLGTFDSMRRNAVEAALAVAQERRISWALDPAHAEASPHRIGLARALLDREPAVLRCNRPEFERLFEATVDVGTVTRAAAKLGLTIAVTGARDIVSDGARTILLDNGHELLTRVTAAGCAATAIVAAFHAIEADSLVATAAALSSIAIAAEIAGENGAGPGGLQVGLLDELYRLTPETLGARLRMTAVRPEDITD